MPRSFFAIALLSLQPGVAETGSWVVDKASPLPNAFDEATCDFKPTKTDRRTEDRSPCPTCSNRTSLSDNEPQCKLYLAESTIPNAGMGLFTAVDLKEYDQVGHGDIVVPLTEFDFHTGGNNHFFLWEDYRWGATSLGEVFEQEVDTNDSYGCVHGFGAAANCHFALNNVEEEDPKFDTAGLHRSQDPGSGAITSYHGVKSYTVTNVPAGAELFVSYGESWFTTREDMLGPLPLVEDYAAVNELLATYGGVAGKLDNSSRSSAMRKDMWDIMTTYPYEGRAINALPKSFGDVEEAAEMSIEGVHLPGSIRSLEWLEANGKCVDNIRPGNSSVPQAGRGAFATRFIPKGGLVAPAPLIHIPDRSVLNMYDPAKDGSGVRKRDPSSIVGKQLLLNYCFGHRNSTLLLSPYGPVIGLINHNSHAPNAEIRWANDSPNHNSDWLDLAVDELFNKDHSGLSFDYIATRDISAGEEILIDYGLEWEEAWTRHVQAWSPPEDAERYVCATELNRDLNATLRTQSEQTTDPYVGVEIRCRKRTKEGEWEMMKCEITSRDVVDGAALYTAEFLSNGHLVQKRARRRAFGFVDLPRSTDMHLPNAFRHEMMIPDAIFPPTWMNR